MPKTQKSKATLIYGLAIAGLLTANYLLADKPVATLEKTGLKIYNEEQYQEIAKEQVKKIVNQEELNSFEEIDLYFDIINEELKRDGFSFENINSDQIITEINKQIQEKYGK